ncbi:MAG: radical SAM protein [Deltaproteobacteria bacterium]|nr:radical SAM protein [Deltaproteobacteria bacterium]
MAAARLTGRALLTAIEYAVVLDCDAKCPKCSAGKMMTCLDERLTHEQIRALADDTIRLGAYEVNFTGGEPTLDDRLEDIVSYFHPDETFLGLNTHGGHLTPERIRRLADAGLDLFKISLDAPTAEEHDRSRGLPGLFRLVMDALDVIGETSGVRAHLCVTARKELIDSGDLARCVDLAKSKNATVGLILPSAISRWQNHHEVLLEEKQRRALDAAAKDPDIFLQANVGGPFECPCGVTEIYVSCYGDVLACPLHSDFVGEYSRGTF